MLSGRGRVIVGGTEGNTLADMCFTGPVTVIGSPVCGSGLMLAIESGTALAAAAIRPGLRFAEGKWKLRPTERAG